MWLFIISDDSRIVCIYLASVLPQTHFCPLGVLAKITSDRVEKEAVVFGKNKEVVCVTDWRHASLDGTGTLVARFCVFGASGKQKQIPVDAAVTTIVY